MLGGLGETLETARLLLPPWSDADTDVLARMAAEPRVVKYVGDGQCWSAEKAADVSRGVIEHWQAHGFGWRVAVEKKSGERVGLVALNFVGEGTAGLDADEHEIGWWLLPSAWGRGLASEGARAVCEECFTRVGAPSVVARLQPANVASAQVATRIGMQHELDTIGRVGERAAVYRLRAADGSKGEGDRA